LGHVEKSVGRKDLEGKIDGVRAVLFKTRNSGKLEAQEPFDREFIYPDITAADYLMEKGIITLGVDYCSVDGFHVQGAPVHHRILKDIFVVEGLDFSNVEPGDYLFVVLPLKIEGADGAPARAVLIDLGTRP
ncbi:cyclase family protein, partial [Candidatus Sumerlaeota bacterium]|nr:cyclase family protein [Candidatus Sumerlaeota bacterium]